MYWYIINRLLIDFLSTVKVKAVSIFFSFAWNASSNI